MQAVKRFACLPPDVTAFLRGEANGAGAGIRTRMSVGWGILSRSERGRRINAYLIPSSARQASYGGPALRSFSEGGLYSPRVMDTPVDTWGTEVPLR